MPTDRMLFAANENTPPLVLAGDPDDWGMIAGTFDVGEKSIAVSVLPPENQWKGKFWRDGVKPHDEHWIVYNGDDEIAQIDQSGKLVRKYSHALESLLADK